MTKSVTRHLCSSSGNTENIEFEQHPHTDLPDLAIVANSVTSSGFTVTWKPIGGVGAYKVRVYQQNDASKTVLESIVTSTAFTVGGSWL